MFRDLRALRPGNARHLFCLSRALKKVGSPEAGEMLEAAVRAGREEVRLKPDSASTTSTWAMRCMTRASWTRPSSATGRSSNSTRISP